MKEQYSIYVRMGLDYEWRRVRTVYNEEKAQELKEYYEKTWRIVEIRDECKGK